MLFSEAGSHPVVSTDTASTVGSVGGFVVDPVAASVVALRVRHSGGDGDTLHWEDVKAFGADVVTVASPQVLVDARGRAAELRGRDSELIGKRLLTDAGTEIGRVGDIEFDPVSGAVLALVTSDGAVLGHRLVGCGSYAVVVEDPSRWR
jgi:sporulation protein YlmC with PRC-barrel domain